MWKGILLAAPLLLAGCAGAKIIVLKHPATGQVQQCVNVDGYIGGDPAEKCARALERDGWVRLGDGGNR